MVYSILSGNFQKNSLCSLKSDYFRKKLRITQNFYFFSTSSKRDKFLGNFLIWWKQYFWSNQWNRTNITENSFAPKMSFIQLNFAFPIVLKHFHQKLTKNFSLRSKKWLSLKEAKNHPKSFFFQWVWNGVNPEEGFWFDGNKFFE